jgi:transmembrane sensor
MSPRSPEATQQAAFWVVQLRAADRPPNSELEFADWLRGSPLHVREYLRAVEVWETLGVMAGTTDQSVAYLVREACDDNVLELAPTGLTATNPTDASVEPPAGIAVPTGGAAALTAGTATPMAGTACAPRARHYSFRGLALAASLLGIVLAVTQLGRSSWTAVDVSTGIGEQRSAILPDHSVVELNTSSEIRLAFTASERRVELLRGEAFFEVAKDPKRPFIVATDVATARAVGTHFSVYRTRDETIVTVAEGRVLVRDKHLDGGEVIPGNLAEARPGHPVQMRPANVERALAWRQRRLIFDGDSLANVVSEFNRYNPAPLVIVDPGLREQRISGVFAANDPDSLLDFLVQVDHINVTRSEDGSIRIGESAADER